MSKTITPYEVIRPNLQTGDEVDCGGKGFFSLVIKLFTWSWCSHVGKIFVDAFGCVWIWHSTSLGKGKSGPQREQFRTFLKRYRGRVEVRLLGYLASGSKRRPDGFQQTYIDTIREFKDKEYENNYLELAGSAMSLIKNKPNLASIFCSEMTAEIDMRTEVIWNNTIPANEYKPKDSLVGEMKDGNLLPGWNYSRPYKLK